MPQKRQASLREQHKRAVSAATDTSALSMDSTVSDFLEKKIQMFASDVEYYRIYQDGLCESLDENKLGHQEYQDAVGNLDKRYEPVLQQLRELKRNRHTLKQDMEDSCCDTKLDTQKRANVSREPSIDFLERAYSSTMATRVTGASSKQKKRNFDQAQFRKNVISYLGADKDPEHAGTIWCHLTGWHMKESIKAAHLVPKTLHGDELTYLFGVGEMVLPDPRNGKHDF